MSKLASGASHVALLGGSRSGKTFLLCYAVLARALKAPGSRHAIFRFRLNALKASIVADTMPKVIKLCFPELPSHESMLKKDELKLTLPNGSEIWYAGLDDKERTEKILGMEFVTLYFNECSQIPWASVKLALTRLAMKCFDEVKGCDLPLRAYYDFNPPSKAHWTYQVFMLNRSPDSRQALPEADYAWHRLNPRDNKANLAADYIKTLEALPSRERMRFLEGVFSEALEGALWTAELIDQNRINGEIVEMVRTVVAVDPSGCSGDEDTRSDEVGIVVCGVGTDGKGYVLEDLSGRYGPKDWATIAASAYERYAAAAIVAEQNFGGAMVEQVILAEGENIHVKLVRASTGKAVRAEPIANLYEKQKVYHAGYFPDLEEQLCAFSVSGYQGSRSPDRADACVWALTELFPKMTETQETRNWSPPKTISRKRSARRLAGDF
tara:strand:- start:732 stop:2048 length:1317 start_codon:yes stop_codon:yes gene_type:complete